MSTEPPSGTAAEVLDWVDDDPQRAQTALEAENCKDNPRSTLVTKLETIADKEAPVSDQTATRDEEVDEAQAEQDELAPEQPDEVAIDAGDTNLNVTPVTVRGGDTETEVDPLLPEPEADEADQREELPVENELVVSIAAVSNTSALILQINGTAYGFDKNMVAALKTAVDKAVVGLAL